MAKIYNSDVTKGLAKNAGIQQSREKIPDELAEKIVPVMETNPELLRKSVLLGAITASTTTGTETVISTINNPITKKTFITCITCAYAKNAACDAATGSLNLVGTTPSTDGTLSTTLLSFPIITLTAQEESRTLVFNQPLELTPNTNVTMTGNFAAGVLVRCCSVYGYQVENINA